MRARESKNLFKRKGRMHKLQHVPPAANPDPCEQTQFERNAKTDMTDLLRARPRVPLGDRSSPALSAIHRLVTVMGCLVLVMASLVGSTPALASDNASHNQWSHCNAFPGKYADQRVTNLFYRGQYGWFFTHQPNVPFPSFQFSVSHLYPHTNNGDTVMEVGWYKGQGRTIPSTTVTRYYTVHADFGASDYVEENWGIVPDASWKQYEAQYERFNFSTNRYVWGLYADNLAVPLREYESQFLSSGLPLSGGEVDEPGVQMQVSLTPNHLLKKPDGVWYHWNEAFMASEGGSVATCNDLGLFWQYFRKFDDYQVTGTSQ